MKKWEIAYAFEGTAYYNSLLEVGWEPFFVIEQAGSNLIYFKRAC